MFKCNLNISPLFERFTPKTPLAKTGLWALIAATSVVAMAAFSVLTVILSALLAPAALNAPVQTLAFLTVIVCEVVVIGCSALAVSASFMAADNLIEWFYERRFHYFGIPTK
ncbi:hypothetical protein [Parachlamydia sp. AcF125]|uniref:hypothetical protein n=1 Tax=Parachlamydia sp. AcF125 TaxID=2795736 RepID=UPI001BCA2601|nr:hypothetical protein [Parachlamydia sp. AcF125]MBS4168866.1 hypothetical protein [Parachlamydia sp. AcF125]